MKGPSQENKCTGCAMPAALGRQMVPGQGSTVTLGSSPAHRVLSCPPEAQLVTGSKPRGDIFPLGGRSRGLFLSGVYRNTDKKCKWQLFLPWLLGKSGASLPTGYCGRAAGGRLRDMRGHQQKCFGECCFLDKLAHSRTFEILVHALIWGVRAAPPSISGVTVIKQQNIT